MDVIAHEGLTSHYKLVHCLDAKFGFETSIQGIAVDEAGEEGKLISRGNMHLIRGLEHGVERNVLVYRPETSRCPIDSQRTEE
jgi:hypothetical protein